MKRIAAGAALALLTPLASGCSGLAGAAGKGGEQVPIPAVHADLEVQVRAKGELEARNASPIAVPPVPTGILKVKSLVPEGSIVRPGDIVLVFDETQLSIELENNMATLHSAERRIDRTHLQAGIESGSIRVMREVAELEREHASTFRLDEVIYSRLEILEAVLGKEYAQEKIVFADASLVLRGQYYDIDERILGVEKNQAEGKIDRAKTSLATLVLKSPIGGMVVYKKNWRGATVSVGDSLWPGNVVMSIVDPAETRLKAFILEKDAAGVETGDEATVRVDAHAEREFAARVASISKLSRPIEQNSPVKYFEAQIEIRDGDPALLKPGMKGEARIVTARLKDAVVIPRSAVRGREGGYHVLIDGEKGAQVRPIQLGPGDRVRVSIAEGVRAGERVLLGGTAPEGEAAGAPGDKAGSPSGRDGAGRTATPAVSKAGA